MATEPTESTDPLTNFFWLLPPPQRRLIDAGLLRMNTGKRSGGKGNNKSRGGRAFRGSVDSVANLGWSGRARVIRRSLTRPPPPNYTGVGRGSASSGSSVAMSWLFSIPAPATGAPCRGRGTAGSRTAPGRTAATVRRSRTAPGRTAATARRSGTARRRAAAAAPPRSRSGGPRRAATLHTRP